MAGRRGNGEGSITKRADGKWLVSLKVGMKSDGKPKYAYKYFDTQAEAVKALTQLKTELGMGIDSMSGNVKVGEWCRTWLDMYKKKLRPTTKTSYQTNIRVHIDKFIGGVMLNKLTTGQIQFMLDSIYDDGKNSISLVIKVYNVLNGAIKQAIVNKMILNNPCIGIAFPEDNTKEIRVFSIEEQKAFVTALEGEQYKVLYMTYLFTGARLGELPALQWKDINFDNRFIDINKKTAVVHNYYAEEGKKAQLQVQDFCKSKSSIRKIVITPMLVELLKKHKEQQELQYQGLGMSWNNDNIVFPTSSGTILQPRNIQTIFERICGKAKIENATMHTLRHSYASRCFEADIDIKIISEQLGHKNTKITYDTYVHVMPDKKIREIDKLNALDGLIA